MTVLFLLVQFGWFFISFSCLIAMARSSNTMLNRSGERRHPCLVPDVIGKALSFCPLSMMVACRSLIYGLYYVEECSLYSPFAECFLSEMGAVCYRMLFPHLLI